VPNVNNTTKPVDNVEPYSAALSAILRMRKTELKVTFADLERESGLDLRNIKRLLSGDSEVKFGYFVKLCSALKLDPGETIDAVEARVAKISA